MRKLTKDQVNDLEQKLAAYVDDVMQAIRDEVMSEVKETLHLWLHQTTDVESTNELYEDSTYEIPHPLEPQS